MLLSGNLDSTLLRACAVCGSRYVNNRTKTVKALWKIPRYFSYARKDGMNMKYAVLSRESKSKYHFFDSLDDAKRQVSEYQYEDADAGIFDMEAYIIYRVNKGRFEEVYR